MQTEFLSDLKRLTNINEEIGFTNDIIKLRKFPAQYNEDLKLAFIPLPFYYSENIRFGNEEVPFTFLFDPEKIKLGKGFYSVRFFVFRNGAGLHRTAHDVMIIE
jgi:hypothetical protein